MKEPVVAVFLTFLLLLSSRCCTAAALQPPRRERWALLHRRRRPRARGGLLQLVVSAETTGSLSHHHHHHGDTTSRTLLLDDEDGRGRQERISSIATKSNSKPFPDSLTVRGGGVGGIAWALVKTAIRNPVLILLMVSSTLLSVYKEEVPYAEQLGNLVGLCIAAYIFYLLTEWQQMQKDAEQS